MTPEQERDVRHFGCEAASSSIDAVLDELDSLRAQVEGLRAALQRLISLTENGWHGAAPESLDGKWFQAGLRQAKEALCTPTKTEET